MIYKVLFQETKAEVPVRENTRATYVEADSEREVREKLADHYYNIELVQLLNEEHLSYEQKSENYKVENL